MSESMDQEGFDDVPICPINKTRLAPGRCAGYAWGREAGCALWIDELQRCALTVLEKFPEEYQDEDKK